jgi:hypothetical protein
MAGTDDGSAVESDVDALLHGWRAPRRVPHTTRRRAAARCRGVSAPRIKSTDSRACWDAADLYERANGRLYVGGDFTLLGLSEQRAILETSQDSCWTRTPPKLTAAQPTASRIH